MEQVYENISQISKEQVEILMNGDPAQKTNKMVVQSARKVFQSGLLKFLQEQNPDQQSDLKVEVFE